MAFDTPRLGTLTFQNPPDQMNIRWNTVQQINQLADGGVKQRLLGYQLQAELNWDEAWIRLQDWTGLMAVANDVSATLTFQPRPATYPARTFEVLWINKFDFVHHDGKFGIWGGTIELVSATPTGTVSELT